MSDATLKLRLGSRYPVLGAYMRSRAPVCTIMGPRGSGKTFGSAQRCLMHMMEQEPNAQGVRPTRGLVTRDSYAELLNTTIPDVMAVLGDFMELKLGSSGTPTAKSKPGVTLADGTTLDAELVFQSSGVQDAPERAKGFQLTYAWFNEVSGTDETFMWRVREALGRYPSGAAGGVRCTWRGMFADTNAFDTSHWLYALLAENLPERWEFLRQPGGVIDTGLRKADGSKVWRTNLEAENLANLPDEYYDELCQGLDDDAISVLLANEFGFFVDGMPVHPWYVDSRHCASEEFEPDRHQPIVAGADFGRTPASTLWQYHPGADRWMAFDELTSENMSASIFGPALKRFIDRKYPDLPVSGWGDPAGDHGGQEIETTAIDIMRAAGIPMRPAPSNNVTLRRAALSNPGTRICRDGAPGLIISPRCKMLRKGLMGGFAFKRLRIRGSEQYAQEPDKHSIYSHVVESAEYALLGAGEGRAALKPREPQLRRRAPRVEYAISNWGG